MCKIVCVTALTLCENADKQLEKIAESGADMLVLRAKELTEDEYKKLAARVMEMFAESSTKVVLHNYVGAALELGADCIHLPLGVLRGLDDDTKSKFRLIGASCHSAEDALEAQALGAGYVTAGHVFETDCKKGLAGRGLDFVRKVSEAVDIPVYGIGGISPENAGKVIRAGADGVCVMSGYMSGEPRMLTEKLREVMNMRITGDKLRLYAITDPALVKERGIVSCVESALKGGANIIQLRDKQCGHEGLVAQARELLPVCHKYGAPLIVNDDWQAAIEAGADGVHVGIEDAPVDEIRAKADSGFIIGATAKTVAQAQNAQAAGADYLGVGALFPSPTKTNAIPVSKALFSEIAGAVSIPCVAIGGISLENIGTLAGMGAEGFAVVSAVFGADDIESRTAQLKEIISGIV